MTRNGLLFNLYLTRRGQLGQWAYNHAPLKVRSLLVRYQTTEDGGRKRLAQIYTGEEHGITRGRIAHEALSVTRRLERGGYEAYIVGGAVRDLLLGKEPNDYDIVTDAHPRAVRRLFRRSRIIGRRFQLVHVYVHDKTLEVCTFRGDSEQQGNVFGTMAEDVRRRDFSMNALYYDPSTERIIDYVGGYQDIIDRRIRLLKPAEFSFQEDPVRMIRALRYAATTGFDVPGRVARGVRRLGARLADCPVSRLTEELFKILSCGASAQFLRYARELGLLAYLLPEIDRKWDARYEAELTGRLERVDSAVADEGLADRSSMLAALCEPFIELDPNVDLDPDLYARELFRQCKAVVSPLTPPNAEVERAVRGLMRRHGCRLPKRRRRKQRR